MACLMVGAKMEEQEQDIPVLSSVIRTAGLTCTVEQLSASELKLLKAWEWNVCVVTSNHFVELYARESALDDMVTGRMQALQHIERITEYAIEAIRLACRSDEMQAYRPSVLATAAVICSRTILEAEPHLPPSLMAISGWGYFQSVDPSADLGACCKQLLGLCSALDTLPASSPLTAHAEQLTDISRSLFPERLGDPIRFPLAALSLNDKVKSGSTNSGAVAGAVGTKTEQAKAIAKDATFGPRPDVAADSTVQMFPVMTW
jgi:hypothetical protein